MVANFFFRLLVRTEKKEGLDENWSVYENQRIYQRTILSASFAEVHQGLHLVFEGIFYTDFGVFQSVENMTFFGSMLMYFFFFCMMWYLMFYFTITIFYFLFSVHIFIHPERFKKINKLKRDSVLLLLLCSNSIYAEMFFFVYVWVCVHIQRRRKKTRTEQEDNS